MALGLRDLASGVEKRAGIGVRLGMARKLGYSGEGGRFAIRIDREHRTPADYRLGIQATDDPSVP